MFQIRSPLLVIAAATVLVAACAAPPQTQSPSATGSPRATPAAAETATPEDTAEATLAESPPTTVAPQPTAPGGEAEAPTMTDPELAAAVAVSGLDQPTGIAFIGDDDYVVIEKATGRVRRVQGGQLAAGPLVDLAVNFYDERGLLGIELHPDFASNGYVYLYWTARDDNAPPDSLLGEDTDEPTDVPELGNRVDRFIWDGSTLTWDREIVRLRSNTLQTDTSGRIRGNHDAGPMEFGPDGMLYVQNGDQNLRGQLQNIQDGPAPDDANLTGVILRLNDDGTIPEDNPFFDAGATMGGAAGENVQIIWAYGIRNSFGLRFHPETGDLWQTENGDDSWDEINRFQPAANSGWIQIMGPPDRFDEYREIEVASVDGLDNPAFPPDQLAASSDEAMGRLFQLEGSQYVAPVFAWRYPPAVTALEFVLGEELGTSSANSIFVGTVLTDTLLRYPLAEDGSDMLLEGALQDRVDDNSQKGDLGESEPNVVGTGFGIVTDIVLGPDGNLYVVSLSNGAVYVVSGGDGAPASPPATGPASPDASPPASPAASPTGSPQGSPTGSPGAGAPVQVVIATDPGTELLFVPEQAAVPSGAQVSLTFQNLATVPHNLIFGPPIDAATSTVVQPGASETIQFTAPAPGDYDFVCTLHPGMDGVLTVTP